jgi:Putative transposase
VYIAAQDRAGLERLLRYCARAPFASARLRKAGNELVYHCAKQHSEPGSKPDNKRGAKVDEIICGGQMRVIAFITYPNTGPTPRMVMA